MDLPSDLKIIIPKYFWRDDLDQRSVLVSIKCAVYNQEKYIRETLEGFVKQKTNFRFEAIIHDDASSDRTSEIIREYAERYPSIIKPIYDQINRYREGTLGKVFHPYLRGKYIAICEGDDYWTNPLKLQKQVDFLEAHPDYSLIRTDINTIDEKGKIIQQNFFKTTKYSKIKDNFSDYIIHSWFAAPCTWLYRKDVYDTIDFDIVDSENHFKGDIFLLLGLIKDYKCKFLADNTANYRISPTSASHFGNNRIKELRFWCKNINTRKYFSKNKLKINEELKFIYNIIIYSSIFFWRAFRLRGLFKWIRFNFILLQRNQYNINTIVTKK